MNILQAHHFGARLHETFDLSLGETTMPLVLADIRHGTSPRFAGQLRDPFTLTFRSTSPVALPQRIYRMNNEAMGTLDIFIVPIGRDVSGILYEAVFN